MQFQRPVEGVPVILVTVEQDLYDRIESLAVELGFPVQEVAAALITMGMALDLAPIVAGVPDMQVQYRDKLVEAIYEIRAAINALRLD